MRYLTRHGQLIASWTHVPVPPLNDTSGADGSALGLNLRGLSVPWKDGVNPPYCLATNASQVMNTLFKMMNFALKMMNFVLKMTDLGAQNPPTQPKMPPDVDITQCLQVWAGPLSDNATVVGLVNACENGTQTISATWATLESAGLRDGQKCEVRDLYAGKSLAPATGKVSAMVGEHDIAVLRLSGCK